MIYKHTLIWHRNMSRKNKYSLLQTKTAVTSLYSLQASTHRHTTTPTSKQPKKSGSVSVSEHTPTPPLTKQQSTDNKLGLMLGWGGVGVHLVKCWHSSKNLLCQTPWWIISIAKLTWLSLVHQLYCSAHENLLIG